MTTTAVYHWWDDSSLIDKVWRNHHSPLITSIATLRACNPDIEILVLYSGNRKLNEFEPYSSLLNFRVVPISFYMEKYREYVGWDYLSRLFDLRRNAHHINTDTLMYCDVDVFWFQDPLPHCANPKKFCFDGGNSGFFYYQPESEEYERFIEVFESYTLSALHSKDMYQLIQKCRPYESDHYLYDEMVLAYMRKYNPSLLQHIDLTEHCRPMHIHKYGQELKNIRMLHAHGMFMANPFTKIKYLQLNCRGLLCLLFSELYERICQVLDPKDIFSKEELAYVLPKQYSLLENPQKLLATRKADGFYYAHLCGRSR
ncbi:hypothetical protein [Teredinibacter sp. KSP-S5-2]|uniref:hypothetical protein n=1 Tax=Teredinibacter sp. KSP-S5-2 TaxID=3034506 RepID=UPI0029348A99|nr:hypothetical protein [Teredinibacter sp. KSP-S5-2]WNO11317.1 hypothetical protein P5V12_09050 [Teredinibacter sp. KSP-S5-2]